MRQSAQDEAPCQNRSVTLSSHHYGPLSEIYTYVLLEQSTDRSIPKCLKLTRAGDRIIVVVQKQRNFGPESGPGGSVSISAANKVRRGDIRHAVVVRTVKKYQRPDGSVVKFDDNACVLINKGGEPIGSRLNGQWA